MTENDSGGNATSGGMDTGSGAEAMAGNGSTIDAAAGTGAMDYGMSFTASPQDWAAATALAGSALVAGAAATTQGMIGSALIGGSIGVRSADSLAAVAHDLSQGFGALAMDPTNLGIFADGFAAVGGPVQQDAVNDGGGASALALGGGYIAYSDGSVAIDPAWWNSPTGGGGA